MELQLELKTNLTAQPLSTNQRHLMVLEVEVVVNMEYAEKRCQDDHVSVRTPVEIAADDPGVAQAPLVSNMKS